jgi:hypothetical protein
MRLLTLLAPAILFTLTGCGSHGGLEPGGGFSGSCSPGEGSFDFQLKTFDNVMIGCGVAPGATNSVTLKGQVTIALDLASFTLDSCSPAADCASPKLSELRGNALTQVRIGDYVEIEASSESSASGSCSHKLLVRNLPSWDGVSNPRDSSQRVLLAGVDGTVSPIESTPFTAKATKLCGYDVNAPVDALQFTDEAGTIEVMPGDTVALPQTANSPSAIKNLRSGPTVGYAWVTDVVTYKL